LGSRRPVVSRVVGSMQLLGFGGRGVSDEDRNARISELRGRLGVTEFSDDTLGAYLERTDLDVSKAEQMVRATDGWRSSSSFPIHQTPDMLRVLDSPRFRHIGWNEEGRLLMAFDFMWGRFLQGVQEEDVTRGLITFFEEAIRMIDSTPGSKREWLIVAVGGPPPLAWGRKIAKICDEHYVGRLKAAIIYPIPVYLCRIVQASIWWLPARVKQKFALASDEADLCRRMKLDPSKLPPFLGLAAQEAAMKAAKGGSIIFTDDENGDVVATKADRVAAGKNVTHVFPIDTDVQWLRWSCTVDAGYDVGIGVVFRAANLQTLHKDSRFTDEIECNGPVTIPGGGDLEITFNNSYSWVNSKNVSSSVTLHRVGAVGSIVSGSGDGQLDAPA